MITYIRFERDSGGAYGILDGETVRPLRGGLFSPREETGEILKVADVRLLHPCEPPKIFAVGRNYKSHVGDRQQPTRPEIFYKPTTSLVGPGDPIRFPPGAKNVHSEGELVVVIGRRVKDASPGEARSAIFGVTCGNDVSERDWQNGPDKDLQWWRAKGADTFGPLGPVIVTGIDYGNLMLQTRINGEVVQKQSTADLMFDCPTIVSWISHAVTLEPGDVIYTGTPGTTRPMKPGDVVEVEIDGIGVLRNPVEG
ncbi:MAG TPA: fumarylacetoacetate hydrolase family protein [Bryobacteraceae bacterium]|nr:fumarylacetoacetate hydrolase family protein [Bryobacteraceae bacterium]